MKVQAQRLIRLLEQAPRNLQIEVSHEVLRALQPRSNPYVSEEQQDKIDAALLRKRKASQKTYTLEEVKKHFGL